MKKTLLLFLSLGVFLIFSLNHLSAQDHKSTKVAITITEDDKVTTDTTFELKKGQDPEMIKKIISLIAGEDIHMNISKSRSHSKTAMIHSDDHVVWHAEEGGDFDNLGIDLDSLKKAHGTEKTMNIFVTIDEDCEGEEKDVEVYVIKKGDKDVKVMQKKIIVEIEQDDDENEDE